MKILLLAPQPFYAERGTPIAVDLLLRALSRQGHRVDALVYPEGSDRAYPGVRLIRAPRWPGMRSVGPGPSWKKLVSDLPFAFAALRLARRTRYDLVHAVEESVFIARLIKRLHGTPYLYDMDSGMADQVLGKYPALRAVAGALRRLEAAAVRGAEVVVPVCDTLAAIARQDGARKVVVLRDISLLTNDAVTASSSLPSLREELGLRGPVAMYVGNLEPYQGVELLLESFAVAHRQVPEARLLVIGGRGSDVARYQEQATRLGLNGAVQFLGPRPVGDLPRCLEAADVLVSPRVKGANTPMKVYSYLDSGRPVLATDLPTHTQVLNQEVAVLAAPEPEAFGDALGRLLEDPMLRRRLGEAGRRLIAERHSYAVFEATLTGVYRELEKAWVPQQPAAAQQAVQPPIFIVGAPRSGTTLLQTLVDGYSDIAMPPESHVFARFATLFERYGDLSRDRNLTLFVRDLLTDVRIKRWGLAVSVDAFCLTLADRSVRGVLEHLFALYARQQGKPRWGEKTPTHALYLAEISRIFPDAKFIHLVRDGRDVAESLRRVPFGKKSIWSSARRWRRSVRACRAFAQAMGPGAMLEVRYEDLVEDPQAQVNRILVFLGAAPVDVGREVPKTRLTSTYLGLASFHGALGQGISGGQVGKFREILSPRDVAIFEAVAGADLVSYGYRLDTARSIRLGPADYAKFSFEDYCWRFCRKLVTPEFRVRIKPDVQEAVQLAWRRITRSLRRAK